MIQAFLAQNYLFIYFWLSAQNYCHINLSDRNLGSALHLNLNLKFYFIIYFLKKVDLKKKKKKRWHPPRKIKKEEKTHPKIPTERAIFGHSLNPERNRFRAAAPKRFSRRFRPLLGLLRTILGWVSSQIFGFFSFSVLLGISLVLETNSLVIVNQKYNRTLYLV